MASTCAQSLSYKAGPIVRYRYLICQASTIFSNFLRCFPLFRCQRVRGLKSSAFHPIAAVTMTNSIMNWYLAAIFLWWCLEPHQLTQKLMQLYANISPVFFLLFLLSFLTLRTPETIDKRTALDDLIQLAAAMISKSSFTEGLIQSVGYRFGNGDTESQQWSRFIGLFVSERPQAALR